MKSIDQLDLPQDCRYGHEHAWAKPGDGKVRIGISDYAQDQLGQIVYVDLPQIGDHFGKDEAFGTVESIKAVSDLYIPIAGEVVAVNSDLEDSPQLLNESPYEEGWIIDIKASDPTEMDSLLTNEAYREMLKKEAA